MIPRNIYFNQRTSVEINASSKLRLQILKALELIRAQAPFEHSIMLSYIERIQEHHKSGMDPRIWPPTVYLSPLTCFVSITWCASCIAHEAYHSKLYQDYRSTHCGFVPNHIWKGQQAELACIKYQIKISRKILAPANELEYLQNLTGLHFYLPQYW